MELIQFPEINGGNYAESKFTIIVKIILPELQGA